MTYKNHAKISSDVASYNMVWIRFSNIGIEIWERLLLRSFLSERLANILPILRELLCKALAKSN